MLVCHGFGCTHRTQIGLGPGDRARLQSIMAGGSASPAAERKGIGAAYAWFEKRVAPEAGTGKAVARTTPRYARDRGQFDCFDKTHNATELLALLAHFGLLRHHVVDVPQSRGLLIDLRGYHTTAVVREKVSGKQWSVDGWTKEKRTGAGPHADGALDAGGLRTRPNSSGGCLPKATITDRTQPRWLLVDATYEPIDGLRGRHGTTSFAAMVRWDDLGRRAVQRERFVFS